MTPPTGRLRQVEDQLHFLSSICTAAEAPVATLALVAAAYRPLL